MPMVTLTKTFDVTNLVKIKNNTGCKFNMLMVYCLGRAAVQFEDFFLLPVGDKLCKYDHLALDVVVALDGDDISTCDIPFSPELSSFSSETICGLLNECGRLVKCTI